MYNQYNLEATSLFDLLDLFKKYLTAEKITKGSIRSYLSDVRHFFSWLQSFLASQGFTRIPKTDFRGFNPVGQISVNPLEISENLIVILKQVNQKVLEAYKDYQESNNIPTKTINRRFSALRRFGAFCQSQNWIPNTSASPRTVRYGASLSASPFDTLRNISPNQPFPEEKHHLGKFRVELWQRGAAKLTIKNYLNDVKQFIGWLDSRELRADPSTSSGQVFRGSDPVSQISVNQPVIRANHK